MDHKVFCSARTCQASREVAEHSLDILPHSRAVQQRLRRFDEEWQRAIGVELRKLLEAGFIKEVSTLCG
jgi:hypothetical protein